MDAYKGTVQPPFVAPVVEDSLGCGSPAEGKSPQLRKSPAPGTRKVLEKRLSANRRQLLRLILMAMRAQTGQINHENNHENKIYGLFLNFCRCGIAGWCLEVMFTSVDSIMAGDWRLIGRTSLIMFPIYGMGALLLPISRFIDSWLTGLPGLEDAGQDRLGRAGRAIRHGLIYMVLIFIAEYITGIWLTSVGICPWDYSLWPDNVGGVIRLKFAPLWFMTGLLFEYLTKPKDGD